jgi:hypothetical protein
VKRFLISLLISTPLLVIVNGCTGSSGEQPGFTPIRPDPTSTPTLAAAATVHNPTPTSVVLEQIPISTFTDPTNRFTIDYPESWQQFEQPNGVIFIEPGDQAGYSVTIHDAGEQFSDEELGQYLVTYVVQNFVDESSEFSPIDQETQADGSIVARFTTVDPNLGPMMNEVHVQQQDSIVLTVLINATEEQWQLSRQRLQDLAETATLLDSSPMVQTTPTGEPPSWILIGSTNSQFGFLYPSDWKILRQDEEVVAVAMPDIEVTFEGSMTTLPTAADDPITAAESAVLAVIDDLSKENQDVQSLPPTEFPLDTLTGVTIDFLYTTEGGTEMAGSIIAAASEDKVYRVIFTAPAEFYEFTLQWFNPMYKSFKILPAEELLVE